MANLEMAWFTDEVDNVRLAMAERELELDAAAKSLEAGMRRLRDADMLVMDVTWCVPDGDFEMAVEDKQKEADQVSI